MFDLNLEKKTQKLDFICRLSSIVGICTVKLTGRSNWFSSFKKIVLILTITLNGTLLFFYLVCERRMEKKVMCTYCTRSEVKPEVS